ncbi:MAG: polysaccharide deacetylase family protein [Candidatus Acidiferrales bacterium]
MRPIPTLIEAGGACAASGGFAWAAVAPVSQIFGPTIRRTGDDSVALTFDDGPNPGATPKLLEWLEKRRVRATFFVTGKHVRAFPDLTREIAQRGHTIGNHTDTHRQLVFRSPSEIAEQLDRCDDAIREAIGKKPRWMRPPFGFRGPLLNSAVRRWGGAGVVMWSVLAWDWKPRAAEKVVEHLRRVQAGDIVLLHDGDFRRLDGDRHHTVAALAHWLPRWQDAGIRFTTLDDIGEVDANPA